MMSSTSAEKYSVGELLSIAIQSHKLDRKKDVSTIFVRADSLKGQHKRRFSDSSILIDIDITDLPPVTEIVEIQSLLNRRNSLDSANYFGRRTKLASLVKNRTPRLSTMRDISPNIDGDSDVESVLGYSDDFIASGIVRQTSISSISPRKGMIRLDSINAKAPVMRNRSKSIREMVTEIDLRVKTNLNPPVYVTKLDKLAPEILTWKKNYKTDSLKTSSKDKSGIAPDTGVACIGDENETGESDALEGEESAGDTDSLVSTKNTAGNSSHPSAPPRQTRQRPLLLRKQSSRIPPIVSGLSSISASGSSSSVSTPTYRTPDLALSTSSSPAGGSSLQTRKRVSVAVDLIGCHHPVELILAKADERSRHQIQVLANRDHNIAQQEASTAATAQLRNASLERRHQTLRESGIKKLWIKVIQTSNTHSLLLSHVATCLTAFRARKIMLRAAIVISLWFIRVRLRRGFSRNKRPITPLTARSRVLMTKYSTQWRIAVAASRIKDFLQCCRSCSAFGFSSMYVRRFINAARCIQINVRLFLQCKRARVVAVLRIWDVLEVQHIKLMLDTQRKIESGMRDGIPRISEDLAPIPLGLVGKSSSISVLKRNRIQALKWIALKEKFRVFDSKSGHGFQKKIDFDIRKSYLLPLAAKTTIVESIIKNARNVTLVANEDSNYKIKALEEAKMFFSIDDAAMLIQGPNDSDPGSARPERVHPDGQILAETAKPKRLISSREPFILYRCLLDNGVVFDRVVDAHEARRKMAEEG